MKQPDWRQTYGRWFGGLAGGGGGGAGGHGGTQVGFTQATTNLVAPGLWSYAHTAELYTVNTTSTIKSVFWSVDFAQTGEVLIARWSGLNTLASIEEIYDRQTYDSGDVVVGHPAPGAIDLEAETPTVNILFFDVEVTMGDIIGISIIRTDAGNNSDNRIAYSTTPSDWTDDAAFTWEHMLRDQDNDIQVGDVTNGIYSSGTRRGSVGFTFD